MFKRIIQFLSQRVAPISHNEDESRREFILNVLLLAGLFLVFIGLVLSVIKYLFYPHIYGSPAITLIHLSFFVVLYVLSRMGYVRFSSLLLVATFFLLAIFMGYRWGVDLEMELLTFAFTIIIAGILIHSRFAFWTASAVGTALVAINFLHRAHMVEVDRSWRTGELWNLEVMIFPIFFFIIATVSWLSNREIEKSLARARRSEADLKKERDSLEITVEQRTRELKETQAEKMTQLYRFAEFGRLSSGLFHDLINPLTAVSLNIEKVKNAGETKQYVDKAIFAAKKM